MERSKSLVEPVELYTETYVDMEFLQAHDGQREYFDEPVEPWSLTGYSSSLQQFSNRNTTVYGEDTSIGAGHETQSASDNDTDTEAPYCLCHRGYHGRFCELTDESRSADKTKMAGQCNRLYLNFV